MTKRNTGVGKGRTHRSHKTKKRLEIKRKMLSEKASKRQTLKKKKKSNTPKNHKNKLGHF